MLVSFSLFLMIKLIFCLSKSLSECDFFPGEATWGGEKTKQEDDYEDASFEVTFSFDVPNFENKLFFHLMMQPVEMLI